MGLEKFSKTTMRDTTEAVSDISLEFSRSSTEAEYRDLASTATELIWLHYGFRDLDIHIIQLLNCYNMSATYLAANPVFHARTRDRFPLC